MTKPGHLTRRQLLRGRLPQPQTPAQDECSVAVGQAQTDSGSTPNSARHAGRVFPLIRPPGAVDEADFLKRCTGCEDCRQACPYDAIVKAPIRFRGAVGTPMIDPASAPCRMCTDMPCIAACPEQALMLAALGPIAEARVLDYNCLAHQGGFCSVCSEQCPAPEAITLVEGKPRIQTDACTGCGVCHYACPAPTNAIAAVPLKIRTTPTANNDDNTHTSR